MSLHQLGRGLWGDWSVWDTSGRVPDRDYSKYILVDSVTWTTPQHCIAEHREHWFLIFINGLQCMSWKSHSDCRCSRFLCRLFHCIIECITMFEMPYHCTFVKSGAHMHFVNVSDIHAPTKLCVWAPPLMEIHQHGLSNIAMHSKDEMVISIQECHM